MRKKNSVALVTGAAKRVGRTISLTLAKHGIKLALHYHKSEAAAKSLLEEIRNNGGEAVLLQADLSDYSDIKKMVENCGRAFGRIDILINNAAVYYETPLSETTESDWQQLLDVNLKAPYFCAKYASAWMKTQKSGKIINISDVASLNPWIGYIPYCISKSGIITLTRGLAKELAPEIQVNAVAPGTVLMGEHATEEMTQDIIDKTLLKKIGKPEDIADCTMFLIEKADYITGAVIPVDGGSSLT
jgi:NAD(P)-dependent dehydrogenase (short-subunit alcohol dehydrogenase family)